MASFHGYVELPKADGDRMVANQFGIRVTMCCKARPPTGSFPGVIVSPLW